MANRAFSKILILVIVAAIVGGGFFAWQYFGVKKGVEVPKEVVPYEEVTTEEPQKEVPIETPVEDKPLMVRDVLRNAAEAYKQWNEFHAVYSSSLIISVEDFFEEIELVSLREKEGKKLRQETYRGSIYGEGAEKRFTGTLESTTFHFPDEGVAFCMGEDQFCKAYTEHTIESVQAILSLLGDEVEHLQRLLSLRIGLEPIIELSYDGTREITYDFATLQDQKEFEEGIQSIEKTAVCDMVGVEFDMKELTDFTGIKGTRPYGDTDPELSSFQGGICFDRETGLASYGEMDVLQVALTGKKAHMKTQMELETFANFHKEPEGLIFPELENIEYE